MAVHIIPSIVGDPQTLSIKYKQDDPPIIFFDTGVWRSMNDTHVVTLQHIKQSHGFRYRYSVTNFIELVSHLEDKPSADCRNPFKMFQSCFRRIHRLCDRDILQSPEMMFLTHAGLSHYIDPIWIADVQQMALAVQRIINVDSLAELTGEQDGSTETANEPRYIVRPSHYRELRGTE